MKLRIVAGEFGGRFIQAPPGRGTRPTAARVREAWFSALGDRVLDARVLDLFAGSGALGIEALSRGARCVHFVETRRGALSVLRDNLAHLEIGDRARVVAREAFAYLTECAARAVEFDLAFADPPYGSDAARRLARRFVREPFAGWLCLEHGPGALDVTEAVRWERAYGDTRLSFLERG
ncbi:MAG: 16S rRNA (guanine(966)-N(2))-methyltransferase RsmD [Gemmatimonadota bacterium]